MRRPTSIGSSRIRRSILVRPFALLRDHAWSAAVASMALVACGVAAQTAPPATPPDSPPADAPAATPPTRTPPDPAARRARQPIQPNSGEFPAAWFYPQAGARFATLIGKPPPALRVKEWIGEEVDIRSQIGKVVVVDFWGTWCGPCMRALPHMIDIKKNHGDAVVVVGLHDGKRGTELIQDVIRNKGINYPIAVDHFQPGMTTGASEAAYRLAFWPTIVVIDKAGKVRAAGLQGDFVEKVVEILLKEPAPEGAPAPGAPAEAAAPKPARKPFDPADIATYAEGDPMHFESLAKLIGTTPADIESPEWINTKPLTFAELKGKWVLLDFWATWCEPCKESIPAFNALQKKYAGKLVVLGVCQSRGGEHMWSVAKEKGIEFPIVRLMSESLVQSCVVDNFPDYYLIDPEGKIRLPDIRNDDLTKVLESMIK